MKKSPAKTQRITIRLPASELAALAAAAKSNGVPLAAQARAAVSAAAREAQRNAELDNLRAELAALRAAHEKDLETIAASLTKTLDRDYFVTVAQHLDAKLNAVIAHHRIQMPGESK